MRTFSIVAVSLINLAIGIRNWRLIRQQRVKPALAMWTFFTLAVGGSLLTYLYEGQGGLLDNILNSTDLLFVSSVWLATLLYGDRSTRFSRFDTSCLVVVLVIAAFWLVTQNHIIANVSIQAIMVIAYFPVVHRLWTTRCNTESFVVWIGLLVAPIVSLFSAKGLLAAVYNLRTIVCTASLLTLMVWIELGNRRQRNPSHR